MAQPTSPTGIDVAHAGQVEPVAAPSESQPLTQPLTQPAAEPSLITIEKEPEAELETEPARKRTPPEQDLAERDLPWMPIDAGPTPSNPETEPAQPSLPEPAPPGTAVQWIDINTADSAELQLLPGIGPVLAQRIVDDRAASGRFFSLNDLKRVKGIGDKTAAKLAPLIVFR